MRREKGFTLIELMIVVTVIAIISAVAYPSYNSYLQRSRRSDAQQLMMDIQSRQKQILIEQRAYAQAIGATNVAASGWSCTAASVIPGTCTNAFYTVTFSPVVDNAATPPSYTVRATPAAGGQASDGTLTLTHAGVRARTVGGSDKGW